MGTRRLASQQCSHFGGELLHLLERASAGGLHRQFSRSVAEDAAVIDTDHRNMKAEEAAALRKQYPGNTKVFAEPITMWGVVEKLALTIDRSDAELGATSQFIHTLQVC